MREFSFPLNEPFNKGIRPHKYLPRGAPYLLDAYNVKIGPAGCQPFEPLQTDIVSDDPPGLRTPQLFSLSTGIYLATTEGVYQVRFDLTVGAKVVSLGWMTKTEANWTVADFGRFQVWCDGDTLYYYDVYGDATATEFYEFSPTNIKVPGAERNYWALPVIRQVEALGGRLFLTVELLVYDTVPMPVPMFWWEAQRAKVLWSRPGVLDLDQLRLMMENITGDGIAYGPATVAGFGNVAMAWRGSMVALKRLGNRIIAYGAGDYVLSENSALDWSRSKGGVTALTQHVEPFPTFGCIEVHEIGVAAGRPVAGDDNRHIFVDSDGVVWSLTADLKKERLGYQEYLYPLMTGSNLYVYVSHDAVRDDYYITVGENTKYGFLLSQQGMSRVFQPVMSIAEVTGYPPPSVMQRRSVQAITRTLGDDLSAFAVSDVLDMGFRGIKTITGLELGSSGGGNLYAGVDYRYRNSADFVVGQYKLATRNGTVSPIVSGADFRLRFKSSSYQDFDLDYVNVRWKAVDKRLIRGVYGAETGQAIS